MVVSVCASLLRDVTSDALNEDVLEEKLHAHVDAKDHEMTLELLGGEEEDAAAGLPTGPWFIGGMDTKNMDFKFMHAEDFKITHW